MRLLLAIKSCQRDLDRGYHDAIRQTWGRDTRGADLQFFTGADLNAPDDYDSLPFKTREILRRSIQSGYDFTFLCDTDTFIIPSRLMSCDFQRYDFSGRFGSMPELGKTFNYRDQRGVYNNIHPWPSGGVGYFVSRKAAEIVVATDPVVWAEDMFVGQALGPHIQSGAITAKDLPGFECCVSWHFPRREYNNQVYDLKFNWLEKMQKEHGQ